MKKFLLRQLDAALFRGHKERVPLLIVAAGMLVALRLVAGQRKEVLYERQLKPGESLTITASKSVGIP